MNVNHYILDDNGEIQVADLMTWAQWFESHPDKRRIAYDELGKAKVSTVFIGLNHNWGDDPPLLFETMIFGGPHDQDQWRYSTREEALAGHERAKAIAEGMAF